MRCPFALFAVVVVAGQVIAQDTVRWVQSSGRDDLDLIQQISRILDEPSPVTKELKAVPLSNLISRYPIQILLDDHALQDENISPDEPITLPSIPGISIRNQLKLIFTPLELTYMEQPGYLLVTTKKSTANVVRLYDVTAFVRTSKDGYSFFSLIRIIESCIEESDWRINGGTSNMMEWRTTQAGILVVNAPSTTQDAIRDLLNAQRVLLSQSSQINGPSHLRHGITRNRSVRKSALRK